MANAKRVAAPVKTSSVPSKASKAVPKTPRASIEPGQREHAGVKSAAPRGLPTNPTAATELTRVVLRRCAIAANRHVKYNNHALQV